MSDRSISGEARERASSTARISVVQVNSTSTKEVLLCDIWKDRKVILAFLRHFGCRFCAQQVSALNELLPEVKSYNEAHCTEDQIMIAAVGFGTIEDARAFMKKWKFGGELYVDTGLNEPLAYKTFKLNAGPSYLLGDDGQLKEEIKTKARHAEAQGFTDYAATTVPTGENSFQIFSRVGGCFVLGPGNTCDYAYRSRFAGDHPDLKLVLAAASGKDVGESGAAYIYPTTKAWAKRLKGGEKFVDKNREDGHMSKENDENYLEILRQDAESRVGETGNNRFSRYSALCTVCIVCHRCFRMTQNAMKSNDGVIVDGHVFKVDLAIIFSVFLFQYGVNYIFHMSSTVATPAENVEKSSDDKCPFKISLLTPKEIDTLAAGMGNIKCDCSAAIDTDITNKIAQERYFPSFSEEDGDNEFENLNLLQLDRLDEGSMHHLLEVNCYMREFLAKAHPLVGRSGPVCPFVPAALRFNSLYFSVVKTSHLKFNKVLQKVESITRSFVTRFGKLEPTSGRKVAYKAVVLVFPDVTLEMAPDVIDNVQLKLKPEFVANGLMIGEFHKHNNACGLRNPDFYPLRTPSPALAIRRIVPTDLVFLSPSKYAPELRLKFLTSYLTQFEGDPSPGARKAVDEATILLETCKNELCENKKSK